MVHLLLNIKRKEESQALKTADTDGAISRLLGAADY
jgi:hypothetical protein